MGGGSGLDHSDRNRGGGGSFRHQSRRLERIELSMGVGIKIDHLNAYFGKSQALFDISMEIAANHATAIIGPSGCGKSTFVRCLNRMHETNPIAKADGSVKIGEMNIYNGVSPVEVRRRIGMVFQKPNPFPTMTVYDNVA